MRKRIWAAALAVLLLAGCARRSEAPASSSSAPSPAADASSAQAPAEQDSETFYPFDGFQWAGDDTLAVQWGDELTWLGPDNTPVAAAQFPLPASFSGQQLTPGEKYVFAAYMGPADGGEGLAPMARAVERDGAFTLVNCALFDTGGKLVRAFPTATPEEMDRSYLPFERDVRFCSFSQVSWLDEGRFVVNDTARLFICEAETGALTLAVDYTEDKALAFTVGESNSFGVLEQSGTDGGKYYFAASAFSDRVPGQAPVRHFYVMDATGGVTELFPDPRATIMKAGNGILSFYTDWVDPQEDINGMEGWYQTAQGGEAHYLGRYDQGYYSQAIHGDGRISYTETRLKTAPASDGTQRIYPAVVRFHTIELATGQETVFDPLAYDYGQLPPPSEDGYFYTLLGARDSGGGVQFLYTLGWEEVQADSSRKSYGRLYLHDDGSGESRLVAQAQGSAYYTANEEATAVFEERNFEELRMVPLENGG